MNRTALARRLAGGVVPGLLLASLSGLAAPAPADAQYMPSQAPVPPPFFALQNARIVTGTGAVIESGTVVIANGLIEAVGAEVEVPGDAWLIDVSGLTVYPGLFDGLSRIGMAAQAGNPGGGGGGNPFAVLAEQANRPRTVGPEDRPATNSWVNAADMLDPDSDEIETWRSGGFTNALVAPDDGIVTGQGVVVNLAGDEQEMVEAGKIANLVVTDGPLFDEDTDIRMVFVDGHRFEEEAPEPRPTEPPAVDMNGAWLLSLNNDSQEATAELEVSEDGTISGVIQGERGEQQITDGWVSGNEFSITVSATMGPGMDVEIVYTGTVEGESIEGNASFGGMRNMDFTGTRPGGGVR
ncbi:MAG: hypothetical protein F4Y74_07375 [Gemmatimonadales bacterium]|nr:hypothetical protein [Gemmatimonadales bacterium]MYG20178.1 hypothetical protein [Gemmatimonadales bacterium]